MTSESASAPVPLSRNRDFQLLWGTQALSSVGQQISTIAFPLLVLGLTGSAAKAGLVGTAAAIAGYAGGVLGAPIVDATDRRLVLIVGGGLRLAAAAAIAVLVLAGGASLASLIVLAALGEVASVPAGAAMQASLVRIVPASQLDQAVAQDQARGQGAGLAGNGLGGLLYGIAAWLPFAAEAIGYLASVLGAVGLRTPLTAKRSGEPDEGFLRRLTGGAEWLLARPPVMGACISAALGNLAFAGVDLLVIVLARHHGANSFQIGLAVAMGAAGGILGAVIAGRMIARLGRLRTVLLTMWSHAFLILLLALAPDYLWLGAILVVIEFLNPASNVVLIGKLLPSIDDHVRGRVISAVSVLTSGLATLGPLLAGVLYERIGSDAVFPLAALAALTALPFTVIRGVRRFASEPPAAAEPAA